MPVAFDAVVTGLELLGSGQVILGTEMIAGAVYNVIGAPMLLGYATSALAKKPTQPNFANQAANQTITTRQPAAAARILYGESRVGGTIELLDSTNNDEYLHVVVELIQHQCEAVTAIYFDDVEVTFDAGGAATGTYAGYAWCNVHLGSPTQIADSDLISYDSNWTTTDRLQGRCYLYVRLKSNDGLYHGLPNITAIVQGKNDIYDPRTGTTGYSTNAALCVANYLCDASLGLGVDYSTKIDETILIAAANTCDEAVTLAAGGTENRYACNGVIDTSQTPETIIKAMNTAKAAPTVFTNGLWRVLAGVYDTPTLSFNEDDLRTKSGSLEINARVPRSSLFNAVKGTYVSPDNNYQPADFPAVTNSTYQTQDGGDQLWHDITLPFTNTPSAAQRIAKIMLEEARQQISFVVPCKLSAMRAAVGSNILWSDSTLGWTDKPFRVTDWQFVVDQDANGNPILGVDLHVRETASTIYSWNSGLETTVDPAPNTTLPDPFTVVAPTGISVSTSTASTGSGDSTFKAIVNWTQQPQALVQNGGWIEIEYRENGVVTWSPSWQVRGDRTQAEINQLNPGMAYDCRIRAINSAGYKSSWATLSGFSLSSGGTVTTIDYGLWSGAVTATLDYGAWSAAVTASLDYGSFS